MEKTASEEWFIPWEEEQHQNGGKRSLNSVFQGLFPSKNRYKVNMAFNTPCICRAAIILCYITGTGFIFPSTVIIRKTMFKGGEKTSWCGRAPVSSVDGLQEPDLP